MDENSPLGTRPDPSQWAKLKPFAREMRLHSTPAEDTLWQRLRNRRVQGAKFRRQHAIGNYIVDFACLQHGLIVEVDGDIHNLPEQQMYDARRQAWLEEVGFQVLRFTNAQVMQETDAVVEVIGDVLQGNV